MFETMYASDGVGLAAPQIGKAIRLFVVDADPLADADFLSSKGFKKALSTLSSPVPATTPVPCRRDA